MSLRDDDVEGLYVSNDTDNLDLSTFNRGRERSFRGYVVIGTPGVFHSPFRLVGGRRLILHANLGIGKSYFGLYIL